MANEKACEKVPDPKEQARHYACYGQVGGRIDNHDSCSSQALSLMYLAGPHFVCLRFNF